MAKILIVDDDENILRIAGHYLSGDGHVVVTLDDGVLLTPEYIIREQPAVVILDLIMPGRTGVDTLSVLRPVFPELPFIIMTAHGSIDSAVEAIKNGAMDYLTKPIEPARLIVAVRNAVKIYELSAKLSGIKNASAKRSGYRGMIGAHESMQLIYDTIETVAGSGATVMITGESGTGKELVARALHEGSGRNGKMVEVNCGAIPRELMESELFGHEKGAFTGATDRRIGLIEVSSGGTLFLDEICELEHGMQVKLLRFLQEKYILRVGGTEKIRIDARIVSATKKDPLAEVHEGHFRDDLYYRLNVIPLHLPALRDRIEDIPALASEFLKQSAAEYLKQFDGFTPDALLSLMNYSWPGNIRELKNTIERIVLLNDGKKITSKMIPDNILSDIYRPDLTSGLEIIPLEELKKNAYINAIKACDGNVVSAAKKLGIGFNTLYRKVKEYDIKIQNPVCPGQPVY